VISRAVETETPVVVGPGAWTKASPAEPVPPVQVPPGEEGSGAAVLSLVAAVDHDPVGDPWRVPPFEGVSGG